jgi:SAM-dependent methyltransferase
MKSYEDYIRLQQSKLQYLDLASHEARFRKALGERMQASGLVSAGTRVLCLGARLGAEVAAFRDLGAFAVGVDLNPGTDNPWVLYGDFHDLEYPDACLDLIYSNSLDHCLEPGKVLAEVRRLVRTDGHFLVEADPGEQDPNGAEPDMWATFQWKTVESLRELVEGRGFLLVSRAGFDYPRSGTALLFALDPAWE